MGIDGGGTRLRVVIVTPEMEVCAQIETATVNPNIVGKEQSAGRIQSAVLSLLSQNGLSSDDITGVGVGIAGAAATHSEAWLRLVISSVLPTSVVVPSDDGEIALVGAHGERRGVLLLSGTGSIAYGISTQGEVIRVGGWGYLLGDEGSGYRIGMDGLQAVTRAADGRGEPTVLTSLLLDTLKLAGPMDLIAWLYCSEQPRNWEVARLAPLVMEAADQGDTVAGQVIEHAAHELVSMANAVIRQIDISTPKIAFSGGILSVHNRLSSRVCELLHLRDIPQPKYPPVIGAALLAQIKAKGSTC